MLSMMNWNKIMENLPEYRIEIRSSAAKEIRNLPQDIRSRIIYEISALQQSPHPKNSIKLKGSDTLYRIRVGAYRIIYDVDDLSLLIIITRVRHRRDAYN